MRLINKISDQAYQSFILTGNVGQTINMILRYMPTQESWFADFEYEGREINGIRVNESPNILRQFHNVIPFGVQCATVSGQDPAFIDDFRGGAAFLYLLTEDEVQAVERDIYGG